MKKVSFLRLIGVVMVMALVFSVVGFAQAPGALAATTSAKIFQGPDELNTMYASNFGIYFGADYKARNYSTTNNFGTTSYYSALGAPVLDIADYFGVNMSTVNYIVFCTDDGGQVEFEITKANNEYTGLLDPARMYWSDPNGRNNSSTFVPATVATAEASGVNQPPSSSSNELRLFYGQLSDDEVTNSFFAKYITEIHFNANPL